MNSLIIDVNKADPKLVQRLNDLERIYKLTGAEWAKKEMDEIWAKIPKTTIEHEKVRLVTDNDKGHTYVIAPGRMTKISTPGVWGKIIILEDGTYVYDLCC